MSQNKLVKPFLKWAGGKRQLVDAISLYLPKKKDIRYFEPFIGAGAIFLYQQPHKAVINDLNEQLCKTYMAVRDDVDELIELLTQYAENNKSKGAEYYYIIREMDREADFKNKRDVEIAARMIYLNKTCYNGLYRVNSAGLFNTPYGGYKNPAICEKEVLRAINGYFSKNDIEIMTGDFSAAVADAKKGDFVYFDPPYDSPNCTNFTGYQAGGFSHQEQKRLKDLMVELTERGVKCLLSNASTEYIESLYGENSNFTIEHVKASRMINSDASGRGKVLEVLVRNWK